MAAKSDVPCSSASTNEVKSVNILVLGEMGVGKTTFIKCYFYANNISNDEMDIEEISIFAKYHTSMKYKETEIDVSFLDIYPGANSAERRKYYPSDVNIILLCFSIGHYHTLKSVYNLWVHEVRSHFGKLMPIFLVGLKSDLRLYLPGTNGHALFRRERSRVVEKCEAEIIHKNYHFHGDYMECTMNNKDSIVDVIQKAFLFVMES